MWPADVAGAAEAEHQPLLSSIAYGMLQAIRAVVNPDKLGHLGPVSDLAQLPEKRKLVRAGNR